jgi:hypothetical protein
MSASDRPDDSTQPTPEKNDAMRQWVTRWKNAGPILDGLRFLTLSEMTDAQRIDDLAMLLQSMDYRVPNDPSGLVAWQKVRERWSRRP